MYSEEHRLDKQREATRRYRQQHPEHKDKAAARYQQKKATDPEFAAKQREKTRQWRAKNPESSKRIQQVGDAKRYNGTKKEAFDLLGNKCARCNYNNPQVLQVDHIIAIGDAKRRELNHRGRILYNEVIAHPEKYQLLCPTHNWEKRVEEKEHKKINRSDTRITTSA